MRVIAGKARRIPLSTVEGLDTRPTTDRIKETLFNMLQNQIPGCHFLDLFSGSGAIGIEALSRGAESCSFVEKNPRAVSCIQDNLKKTNLETGACVFSMDVLSGISKMKQQKQKFDIIFMDPPYDCFLEKKVLELLQDGELLQEDSVIIVEASLKTDFSYMKSWGYELQKEKRYTSNKHVFLTRVNHLL